MIQEFRETKFIAFSRRNRESAWLCLSKKDDERDASLEDLESLINKYSPWLRNEMQGRKYPYCLIFFLRWQNEPQTMSDDDDQMLRLVSTFVWNGIKYSQDNYSNTSGGLQKISVASFCR